MRFPKFAFPTFRVCDGIAFLALALFASQAGADDGPVVRNLLNRMSHAISNMDYQGVFVYQRGDELETIRIVHRATEEGEVERLVSLNGAPREIVRKGDVVTCIMPQERSVMVDRRLTQTLFPALPPSQSGDLEKYYAFKRLGQGRVAGLEATVIGVNPKDKYRYGYRLWLEDDTAMLLKSELLGHNGQVIERLMFTSINLGGNVPIAALRPNLISPTLGFSPRPPPQPREKRSALPEGAFNWGSSSLPPGFRLKVHQWERLAPEASAAEHLVFTDGLASVSVYVERADEVSAPAPAGATRLGAISVFVRDAGEHRITVVGEVPAITTKTIAAGMHRRGASLASDD